MRTLRLNIVELLEIVRVCGSMQVDKCSASYLSDYLAGNLAALDPELAVKIRRFDEDQLDALGECISKLQAARHSRHFARGKALSAG